MPKFKSYIDIRPWEYTDDNGELKQGEGPRLIIQIPDLDIEGEYKIVARDNMAKGILEAVAKEQGNKVPLLK